MAEAIVDGTGSGFFAAVTSENRLLVDISGATINIGSVSANVDSIYVQSGLITVQETIPTSPEKNNPTWKFEYDDLNNLGSVTEFIGAGSYVNVLTWEGFSGTSIGLGSRVSNIGSFS